MAGGWFEHPLTFTFPKVGVYRSFIVATSHRLLSNDTDTRVAFLHYPFQLVAMSAELQSSLTELQSLFENYVRNKDQVGKKLTQLKVS